MFKRQCKQRLPTGLQKQHPGTRLQTKATYLQTPIADTLQHDCMTQDCCKKIKRMQVLCVKPTSQKNYHQLDRNPSNHLQAVIGSNSAQAQS